MQRVVLILLVPAIFGLTNGASAAVGVKSPDGHLAVDFNLNPGGIPVYQVRRDDQTALRESRLGLIRSDADFSQGMVLTGTSKITPVKDRYEILTAKRRIDTYRANRKVHNFATADGRRLDIIFQVSVDGVAFRYFFPEPFPPVGSTGLQNELPERLSEKIGLRQCIRRWMEPVLEAVNISFLEETPFLRPVEIEVFALEHPSTHFTAIVHDQKRVEMK